MAKTKLITSQDRKEFTDEVNAACSSGQWSIITIGCKLPVMDYLYERWWAVLKENYDGDDSDRD